MFNLHKNQAVNIEEVELIERNNQIVVDACNGWKNTDEIETQFTYLWLKFLVEFRSESTTTSIQRHKNTCMLKFL